MSVRGVWVIRPPERGGNKRGTVLFSKRYPTVERRCKLLAPSLYHALPADPQLCEAVITKCSEPTEEFLEERDSCSATFQNPVYELLSGKLWPVVCLEQNGAFFVAAPLVECSSDQRPALIEIPSIPVSLALLEGIAEIVGPNIMELDETSARFLEVHQYLCLAAPFGSPVETVPANLKFYLQLKKTGAPSPKQKQPAWRPAVYKGSSRLQLTVKEEIRAVQYDRPDVADVWEIYGSVQCKAEVEGHPDILLTLVSSPGTPPLDHLITHPCVQSADVTTALHGSTDQRNRKIRFSAPNETFTLCSYQVPGMPVLPIRGFYQMKGESTVQILVQLKLNEIVRNSFDYCEVHLPFFHRGPIQKIDNVSPTTASAALSILPDKRTLTWTIGQKFPSRTNEMSLQATVLFQDHYAPLSGVDSDDPFCVGLNTYADLFFKISDFTLSGCSVDSRSITLFPPSKYKLSLGKELVSAHYRIWNSHGDATAVASQSRTVT
jgi:AP-5 complex subunit mu-1